MLVLLLACSAPPVAEAEVPAAAPAPRSITWAPAVDQAWPSTEGLPPVNAEVLALAQGYEPRGHGGYAWPAPHDGTTIDLFSGQTRIARGGEGNHCVGMTLEVAWRVLEAHDALPTPTMAKRFKSVWYVPAWGGQGAALAIPSFKLGRAVSAEEVLPGDFGQMWAGWGGHSFVFIGWIEDGGGQKVGLRYWSSQPWSGGIGLGQGPLGEEDPITLHFARLELPAP